MQQPKNPDQVFQPARKPASTGFFVVPHPLCVCSSWNEIGTMDNVFNEALWFQPDISIRFADRAPHHRMAVQLLFERSGSAMDPIDHFSLLPIQPLYMEKGIRRA